MMSLAALAACTNDDFQSQNVVAEESSPVKFEVINNNDDFTRASMNGNAIVWNADDGDLFTLYHGGTASGTPIALTNYQNATYTAVAGEDGGAATLTTPSMILKGSAVMVWPVDTAFTNAGTEAVAISIPETLENIENNIPYVSDLVNIGDYAPTTGAANTAGYDRKYPVYMRPMASQLTIKADYAGTDATLEELYTGDDAIKPINVTSVELRTKDATTTPFTTKIPLAFTEKSTDDETRWDAAVENNAWSHVTGFGTASTKVAKLTTKVVTGTESAKFLILPQTTMSTDGQGVSDAAVVVNTRYGSVMVAKNTVTGSSYTDDEIADAWYRFVSKVPATEADGETTATTAEASGDNAGKYKATSAPEFGMKQTINGFSAATASSGIVKTEPIGAAATRYVKVLLSHLDMSNLHIDEDKWLRDAARVWSHMGAAADVTVYLDGDDNKEFAISQTTIATINEINEAAAEDTGKKFTVMPCTDTTEDNICNTIVITGGGDVPANLDFIVKNGSDQAYVALNEGETWKWAGTVTVDATKNGIKGFVNRGTMTNAETATLAIYNNAATPAQVIDDIKFENATGATWNVTAGDLNVQFHVTNYGTVNISKGAEYHQDGQSDTSKKTVFTNDAKTLPARFLAAGVDEEIGVVNNSGVFATVGGADINNYGGLIEHADKDAKTYITANQLGGTFSSDFNTASNKIGRINLPYSNKDEDNVSINAAAATGFVSVTVSSGNGAPSNGKLDLSSVGNYVNYCIVESGITEISKVSDKIKFVEFNSGTTEIAWSVASAGTYTGLIVLSPVNIKYGTTVKVNGTGAATYLGAKMYVGGTFNNSTYDGYYGGTSDKVSTLYITY